LMFPSQDSLCWSLGTQLSSMVAQDPGVFP
jgi:hypothetical protein